MRTLYPSHRQRPDRQPDRPVVHPVAEPPRPTLTWEQLLQVSPGLARYEIEAGQAGENRFGYWLQWVRTYGDFKTAVGQASEATGASYDTCVRIVTARLTAAYDVAAKPRGRCR